MSELPHFYVAFVVLAAVLGGLAIGARRRLRLRLAALGVTALALAAAYLGFSELLSRPKPTRLEWLERDTASATVLAAAIREHEGIYLWLQLPEEPEPRGYVLPWNRQSAEELQDALRDSDRVNGNVEMRRPFDLDYPTGGRRFHVALRPLPTKNLFRERIPTYYYNQSE